MTQFFEYGKQQINHLKQRDRILGQAMDAIGHIQRKVEPDIFICLTHQIIGQQISTAAQNTIWQRLLDGIGCISPAIIHKIPVESFRKMGISRQKAIAIREMAEKFLSGELKPHDLNEMEDKKLIKTLCSLNGVGKWTAEMVLIFSLQRPDVLSFGDFGIKKGLSILYHHEKITSALFETYKNRYSPFGSIASLYLWEIAAGKR